jgi:anti-sigma regulatory factor (Ser/Thr protein kinase)
MSVKPESPRESAEISEWAARGQAPRPVVENGTDFPHEPESVGRARHALSDALQRMRVAPTAAEDAVLILSELVSNALRHAMPLSGGTIRVGWWMEDSRVLRIAVTDGGRQHPDDVDEIASGPGRPGLEAADLDYVDESAVDGRGLGIVGLLADAWGVEVCPQDGRTVRADDPSAPKTVWAAVRLYARHAATSPPPRDPPRRWWRRMGTALSRFPGSGRIRGMRGARLGGARLGQARGGSGDAGAAGPDTAWVPRYPAGVRMIGV